MLHAWVGCIGSEAIYRVGYIRPRGIREILELAQDPSVRITMAPFVSFGIRLNWYMWVQWRGYGIRI